MLWSLKEENISFCIRQVGEIFPFKGMKILGTEIICIICTFK